MKEYTELFPFSLEKNWDPNEFPDAKRYKGAKALRKAKTHVMSAIKQMENALKKVEPGIRGRFLKNATR